MDLFNSTNNLLPFDGEVFYSPNFLTHTEQKQLFDQLIHTIPWESDELIIFGKKITTKRKIAFYSDNGIEYTYSGFRKVGIPWFKELMELKSSIESHCNTSFNACLLNLYHDGDEGMGWHSDNEPELQKEGVIASVSIGITRRFDFKHNSSNIKKSILLESGSLLCMQGKTQEFWKHQLPKSKKIAQARINLTFRQIRDYKHQTP